MKADLQAGQESQMRPPETQVCCKNIGFQTLSAWFHYIVTRIGRYSEEVFFLSIFL